MKEEKNISHPFKTPNSYFEHSRQEILNQTVRANHSPATKHYKYWAVAFASFCLLIGGILFYPQNDTTEMMVVENSEVEIQSEFMAYDLEAEILSDALNADIDEDLDQLILSSIDEDLSNTDLYINDVELELYYYENE